ncbi:hypothetical protein [Thermosulfurimonas sp. F29]|uniref:hypothetical protein n=1 Tax=Thermosulfurimonas sp. F29 TaxID=2867247 RepID=UPI001C83DCDE|nr:hypothetical protein [Thermosulfurimonas sp. F29]MBX6424118.1 hypothetical protein [Thermosulfurimonas sp. F29]
MRKFAFVDGAEAEFAWERAGAALRALVIEHYGSVGRYTRRVKFSPSTVTALFVAPHRRRLFVIARALLIIPVRLSSFVAVARDPSLPLEVCRPYRIRWRNAQRWFEENIRRDGWRETASQLGLSLSGIHRALHRPYHLHLRTLLRILAAARTDPVSFLASLEVPIDKL